jgi:biotin synthase
MQALESIRHDWAVDEIESYHDPLLMQGCALLSVKTGGCAEDCAYCPQSSRYETGLPRGRLMSVDETLAAAEAARADGATRFCMGAAWRSAPRGAKFERVLENLLDRLGMQLRTEPVTA